MTIDDVEDHVRTYTADEDEQLALQLLSITADCHAGTLVPISLEGLRAMHRRLFDGVRDHAGRFRARAFGDEHLVFGPNRSVHRDQVLGELQEVFGSSTAACNRLLRTRKHRTTSAPPFTSPCGRTPRSFEFIRSSTATDEPLG